MRYSSSCAGIENDYSYTIYKGAWKVNHVRVSSAE